MATLTTVRLTKGDSPNWGFRLQGGKDFGTPLVIQKVNGGSPAERAGLIAGDAVIKINNVDVYNLLHKEAQDVIVRAGPSFEMVIQRGGSTWKPAVIPTGTLTKPSPSINSVSPVTKTSLAAPKGENIGAIGTGHNLSAKPFTPEVNGAVNGGPKLVNKQYNTPLKLYSEDAIAETISAQSEVLSTGALGVNFKKNEKNYDATNSAVYRMLKEAENDPGSPVNESEPDSGIVTAPNKGVAGLRHVTAPQTKPAPANPQLPPGQNVCAECERLIVGVFVRIKDKNLHVECFKCSTCGSSLKNVGYYNINNKLYCDIHAKAAAIAINNPSAVPVTIPPGGKAPVSAISAALSSHSLPSPSPLSPKTSSFAPSYPPGDEQKEVDAHADGISSAPSYEPNIKPSSNSPSLYNSSAPLSFSKFINKSSNLAGPKPFSSVSAPLSPGGTLPRAAPLSPQTNFNKAPTSPHSYGSYSPSSTGGRSTNIIWPPPHEDPDIPTACPLFYPPPSNVEVELAKKAAKKQTQFESDYFAEESEEINLDETMSFYSEELSFTGRRSATECVEILSETLDTQKLIENAIKASPNLTTPSLTGDDKAKSSECPLLSSEKECCHKMESCELRRPTEYNPNTTPKKIENAVPQKWESTMTQAIRTTAPDSDTFSQIPARRTVSPLASALAIAPAQPFNPFSQPSSKPIPLPEETEPYFPPEHPILPVKKDEEKKKEEKPPIPKPYSPFVKALEIAPERPFTPVGLPAPAPPIKKKPKDPLDALLDELPKPSERLDMRTALTTAPDRPYTPIFSETSSESEAKLKRVETFDRSQLTKPLKPEELPASFQMNKKEPKPPSYYAPAVIEERIKAETQETIEATEKKETKIIEKEIFQPAQLSQHIITTAQEPETQTTTFAPFFQGFCCSFKNKTDHSQFSVEVSTTPPVPTPPPKPQTPISYIATVEEKPAYVTREKTIEEKTGLQQTTKRQENLSYEMKQQTVEKQAEEVIQVKPIPATAMLRKPEALPSYQLDLQATAEADLRIMEKKRKAEERLKQQKREKEQQQMSIQTNQNATTTKPIITIEPGETNNVAQQINFQPVLDDKPMSTTFSPRPRSITPSMISKAPPLLPYYQDDLVPHFHTPIESNVLDPTHPEISRSPSPYPGKELLRSRSPSPFPKSRQERPKSPAEGPPPNPLHSSRPLPTPQDTKIQQAKENLKSYIPEYKSKRDLVEQQIDKKGSQNIAQSEKQFSFQSDNLQQQSQQRLQVSDSQQRESQVSQTPSGNARRDVSEKSHQEHLEASSKMQSQLTEMSADGRTQIQRKKIVREEYERSHKESNIQIETNITSSSSHPFSKVNVPAIEPSNVHSFHVTNPHHVTSSFKTKEECHKLDAQQECSKLSKAQPALVQSENPPSEPLPPQPPVRRVFPPGSLAPIKHVTPPSACRKPSENVTKPNVPKPDVGAGSGRQAGGVTAAPKRGRGLLNSAALPGTRIPLCGHCHGQISVFCMFFDVLEHANELHQTNPTVTDLDEVCQQLPPPPPIPTVPVYSEINITIPQQNFQTSSQLDSLGSSPKSDYSSHSSTSSGKQRNSSDIAKDKIITEINKGLIPKLKRVSISETQSPRLNFIVSNVNTVIENNVKRVKSELLIPINNNSKISNKVATEKNLPDHLTFANKTTSHEEFTETVFQQFNSDKIDEKDCDSESGAVPICWKCNAEIHRGPFITALGQIWCPQHFVCATPSCRRPLQDLGFVEEKGQLYCEYCFEQYLAPNCAKCNGKIKGDCLKAIGKNFHPECFCCVYCGKLFGNNPFFLEDGNPYCDADWNELFTTKCFACGFPVEAGDRWVEALNNNYHSQCFNCTMCKKNLEGQSFFAKGGRPFCKNHAR